MAKVYDIKVEAVQITATLKDFNGDVDEWKIAFYNLWRWQMTIDYAYRIAVRESSRQGVYVELIVKYDQREPVLNIMEDLGYKNIKTEPEWIGVVDPYEHDECMGIECISMEY